DGCPFQVIGSPRRLRFEQGDLRDLAPSEGDREWRLIASEFAQRSFDLTRGPLLRVLLLKRDEQEHVLVVAAHHMVIDHLSVPIFMREVGSLYEGFANGWTPSLPELPIQYADFAQWHRRRIEGARGARLLEYWKEVF